MSNHLFDAIRAAADPEAPFIETADGRGWTYGDMLGLSGQLAGALAALGVTPGDRVAVQVEKSPEALMLYLACVRAGAVYLPLNTAYTLAELDYFIGNAEPRLVVVAPKSRDGVSAIAEKYGARVETLDDAGGGSLLDLARAQNAEFTDVKRGPDDLAAILYTSGTTGRSKAEAPVTRAVFDPARGENLATAIVERTTLSPGARVSGPAVIVERETSTVVTSPFDVVMQDDGALLLLRKEIGA